MIEGGDSEAVYAYYCFHKFGMPPSRFAKMSIKEKAFIAAAVEIAEKGGD
jgi:hypothetical protein